MTQSKDALKLTRPVVGQVSPLSGSCRYIDKIGHPFVEVIFEDVITFSFAQEGKMDCFATKFRLLIFFATFAAFPLRALRSGASDPEIKSQKRFTAKVAKEGPQRSQRNLVQRLSIPTHSTECGVTPVQQCDVQSLRFVL
jgi:hypothetical protein